MISALLIFTFSCLVSFAGSLQLGPVNLFVINTVLHVNKKSAYWLAIGGSLPEFVYCGLAVFANGYLLSYDWLITILKVLFIAVLVIIGFVFYFKKPSGIDSNKGSLISERPVQMVFKGFSLAALNPQLLPFWMFIQVYFNSIKFLEIQTNLQKFSYILGAGVGALVLLVILVNVVSKYKQLFLKFLNHNYYFKVLSLLVFAIAGHQIWLIMN